MAEGIDVQQVVSIPLPSKWAWEIVRATDKKWRNA